MRRLPLRRLPALAARLLLSILLASALLVLALRWLPPSGSALMVERKLESWLGYEPIDLQRDWRPWQELPDDLKVAVIAAEDQKFADHWGFDLGAIRAALAHNERGGNLRGASTLSQQVAKNLFLWNGRSWVRKGIEAWFTVLVELLWPKQRILEVYLNIAEFGRGIYGVEAASQAFYRKSAARLSRAEAARLAAVLPNPIRMRADKPSKYVQRRQREIEAQMRALGGTAYLSNR
jgi:monofunctional biosynthetic peptidoglycan transglycosylase